MKDKEENIPKLFHEMALCNSQNAFNSLYTFYFERLIRFTVLYVHSLSEAEEIVSDTFLALWNNRLDLPEVSNVDAYIFSIVRHKIVDYQRKKRLKQVEIETVPFDLYVQAERSPEDDLISKEELLKMKKAINSLPPRCKMTFELIRNKQLTYKEVATILGVSVKTVEYQMTTAIKKLRETIACN